MEAKCLSLNYEEWLIYGNVWKYEDYVELLNAMLKDNMLILGGDILDCAGGKLGCTGCNWYYDGDSLIDSNVAAQTYLAGIADWAKREKLFISFSIKKRD